MSKPSFDTRLVWRDDGHLGDAALSCFADGEEALLPAMAATHLDICQACTARLGEVALFAARAAELLEELGPAPMSAVQPAATPMPQPQPLALAVPIAARRAPHPPLWALVAAMVLAGVGALPAAIGALHSVPTWFAGLMRSLPVLLQSATVIIRHGNAALAQALAVSTVASLLLILFAASVARRMSRKAPLEGGV